MHFRGFVTLIQIRIPPTRGDRGGRGPLVGTGSINRGPPPAAPRLETRQYMRNTWKYVAMRAKHVQRRANCTKARGNTQKRVQMHGNRWKIHDPWKDAEICAKGTQTVRKCMPNTCSDVLTTHKQEQMRAKHVENARNYVGNARKHVEIPENAGQIRANNCEMHAKCMEARGNVLGTR